jgi:hypothetical protein
MQVCNLAKHMIAHALQQFSTNTPKLHDDKQLYALLPVTDRATTLIDAKSQRAVRGTIADHQTGMMQGGWQPALAK